MIGATQRKQRLASLNVIWLFENGVREIALTIGLPWTATIRGLTIDEIDLQTARRSEGKMQYTEWTRRSLLGSIAAVALAPAFSMAEENVLRVAKSPTCGCCGAWVEHMRNAGFDVVVTDMDYDALQGLKAQLGITPQHASCHTAQIGNYVVEGHVPAADVKRLLQDRPDGLGLAVPGMPVGSPGMEMGGRKDPYDVVLIRRDGQAEVFQAHR